MFDETNKTEEQETLLPETLFGGEEEETLTAEEDNHISEAAKEEEKLKIKYNGEEREISLDEARILAQKGMNYDHVVAERDTKYKRELDFLDKVAAEKGMSRSRYIEETEKTFQEQEKNTSDVGVFAARAKDQIKRISESVGLSGAWSNLFKAYPELSRRDAAKTLSDAVKSGFTPLEAYQQKLISEQKQALKIAEQNERAATRSVGSLESDAARVAKDDFLEGFFLDD